MCAYLKGNLKCSH